MSGELLKIDDGDFQVIYEIDNVNTPVPHGNTKVSLYEVEEQIAERNARIEQLDKDIDKMLCRADGLDYTVAVACGIFAGLIDSFYVGEINWQNELKITDDKFNKFVMNRAGVDTSGYDELSDEEKKKKLQSAIRKLEGKYGLPSDNSWKKNEDIGRDSASTTYLHHIDDLCHHPTPIGFLACLLSVMFKMAVFIDKNGRWHFRLSEVSKKDWAWFWGMIIGTGLLLWLCNIAEKKYSEKQLEEIPKPMRVIMRLLASAPAAIQIFSVLKKWIGHLISDIAGSSTAVGRGVGIPGILLSSLKELCSIPPLNMIPNLHKMLDMWLLKGFDARAEATVLRLTGKQAVPVIANEVLVRGFYFVRRFINEAQIHGTNWNDYDWENTIPVNNRTIVRMLTVAHGTFVAVDLADAAIRTAVSGEYADVWTFLARMALRVNFVGIGRFTLAVYSEVKMASKEGKLRRERINQYSQLMQWSNAKLFLLQGQTWVAAEASEEAIQELSLVAYNSVKFHIDSYNEIHSNLIQINDFVPGMDQYNPGLRGRLIDCLEN